MDKNGIKNTIAEMIAAELMQGNIGKAAALQYALKSICKERPKYAYLEEAKNGKLHCTNCGKKYKPNKITPFCGECGCKFLGVAKSD